MQDQTDPQAHAGALRTVISVDAMGGDRGPAAVVAGLSSSAKKNPDIRFILHGPEQELKRLVGKLEALDRPEASRSAVRASAWGSQRLLTTTEDTKKKEVA